MTNNNIGYIFRNISPHEKRYKQTLLYEKSKYTLKKNKRNSVSNAWHFYAPLLPLTSGKRKCNIIKKIITFLFTNGHSKTDFYFCVLPFLRHANIMLLI